jgi:hypothetical protein
VHALLPHPAGTCAGPGSSGGGGVRGVGGGGGRRWGGMLRQR